MGSGKLHAKLSRRLFGEGSLGVAFQRVLDRTNNHPDHRVVDHTWDRYQFVKEMYGPYGEIEFLLHLALDYGFIDSSGLPRFEGERQTYRELHATNSGKK